VRRAEPADLRALAVRQQVGDRDALQPGDLAELGRPLEARSGGAQHDHAAVAGQQLAVPHRPVALPVAYSLGESNTLISQSIAAPASSYNR
jgi:hypothetical protein